MGDLLYFPATEMADLYAIGLQVPVPTGAKFIDYSDVIDEEHRELWGSCVSQYSEGKMTVEVAVNGLLPIGPRIFARGHEEGHAALYLGHLEDLKKIADGLEVSLDFFTDDYCSIHDEATKRFLKPGYGSSKDYEIARGKPFHEKEMIANIGGLAALVNLSANEGIIEEVREAICKGKVDAYPVVDPIQLF
jgi:hypothetical protein